MLFKDLIKLNIPDYILSQKLNADVIDIVLDYIEANSNISYDISKIFTCENSVIKKEFVNTYLENISSAFEKATTDQNIQERLTKVYNSVGQTYDPSNLPNIAEVFTDEYLNVAKAFKQRKGTTPAIKFAYNAIRTSGVQGINLNTEINDDTFLIELGTEQDPTQPFFFRVEGSLYPEVYENSIKPIVHPVGFGYIYSKVLTLLFTDYVDVKLSYTDKTIKVVCNNGAQYIDYSDKEVKIIFQEMDENGRIKTTVEFQDGTYIIRDFNTTVSYFAADNTVIVDYPDSCALYLDYTLVLTTSITEEFTFELDNTETDYYFLGGHNLIGYDLVVGSFIIHEVAELYNTVLIYDDIYNSPIALNKEPPVIGFSDMTIGAPASLWYVGITPEYFHNIGEDNYFVKQELIEEFIFDTIVLQTSIGTENKAELVTENGYIISL